MILVIGSGFAGLTAIKACKEENLDVICYEAKTHLGGIWAYSDKSDEPSIMKNTVSNSSKEMAAFSDFPPPSDSPTYLQHAEVLKYLQSYAEHFDLIKHITYSQEVLEVIPSEDYDTTGKWIVTMKDLKLNETREEIFEGVMACTGHHHTPDIPSYPHMDLYKGKIIHSCNYKYFTGLENETVLVVGAGNSGADIAAETSTVAKKVYLSTRSGAWIFPRLFQKGKPLDTFLNRRFRQSLPSKYVAKKTEKILNDKMDHKRVGIKPRCSPTGQHPTVNDEIQAKFLAGIVTIKGDIKEFAENGVRFEDNGEVVSISVVIFATGFQIKFPYLNEHIVRVGENNKIHMYGNVFPPHLKHHTLGLIGLAQPLGALYPVFELQARWFISVWVGRSRLPTTDKMLSLVQKADRLRARAFTPTARHAVEVHWISYMDSLAEKIGAKPNLAVLFLKDPKLFYACYFGPCLPYQYRLKGPHKWEGAREAILNYKERLYMHLKQK